MNASRFTNVSIVPLIGFARSIDPMGLSCKYVRYSCTKQIGNRVPNSLRLSSAEPRVLSIAEVGTFSL